MIAAVPSMTVAELGVQARNTQSEVVIVDYLGLMTGQDRKASEYDRITQVSGDLKRLAKRLNCVVLALCQLNRESAGSTDIKPKLSQLRSSGAIEQDADGVLLLHRPEYGQRDPKRNATAPEQFFVDVAKNRHGRTGTIELKWYAPVNRFEDEGERWTAKSWS
jgi:replicative DNA helicase